MVSPFSISSIKWKSEHDAPFKPLNVFGDNETVVKFNTKLTPKRPAVIKERHTREHVPLQHCVPQQQLQQSQQIIKNKLINVINDNTIDNNQTKFFNIYFFPFSERSSLFIILINKSTFSLFPSISFSSTV